jgi:hypothetical protein
MQNVSIKELAVVALVGYGLAKVTQSVPYLNENKTLTRTALYTLGYFLATRRPAEGYLRLSRN